MQRKVRDDNYGLGLLKPDTFAEDRLLRQPPGVCIMLVMYNRYHNYAATQLRRINENGRFSVPRKYQEAKLLAAVSYFVKDKLKDDTDYQQALERFKHANQAFESNGRIATDEEKMAFRRDPITRLFKDEQTIEHLTKVMDEPISNYGPTNVPRSLKAVEVLGIIQARKWGVGTLNDFREFFGMKRHESFESISGCVEVQNALRDLYEHPDKVELYPGIFCESDASQNADPGPSDVDSALWAAIFSDAITLVRSDRFYTVDWNTNSLTSWGMKEATPDNDVLKSSVFHRLLQRSFPEWFPTNSVRFFHPFYTAQKNAEYAAAQGYGKDFAITPDTSASNPRKPVDPKILTDPAQIMAVLDDHTDNIVHPVRLETDILPAKVAEVLAPRKKGKRRDGDKKPDDGHREEIDTDTHQLMTYFT
ncbi:heme peroxidase-domain-containing protein, partial [Sordaria sp. MPI-SDFR-AT-0083]